VWEAIDSCFVTALMGSTPQYTKRENNHETREGARLGLGLSTIGVECSRRVVRRFIMHQHRRSWWKQVQKVEISMVLVVAQHLQHGGAACTHGGCAREPEEEAKLTCERSV
jgi:hypothetical protein